MSTETFYAEAEELGRRAAREDTWMVPDPDDDRQEDDMGRDFLQREIDGWTDTIHFQIKWLPYLRGMVETTLSMEARHQECQELVDAFFKAWLEEHDKDLTRRGL